MASDRKQARGRHRQHLAADPTARLLTGLRACKQPILPLLDLPRFCVSVPFPRFCPVSAFPFPSSRIAMQRNRLSKNSPLVPSSRARAKMTPFHQP
jgi:hypothetical protein